MNSRLEWMVIARMDGKTKEKLYAFMRKHTQAVIATAGVNGKPEAALVDIAVTPDLEIVFETTSATRKFANLNANARVSFVIGWEDSETLQYDGRAERAEGHLLDESRTLYFSVFPEKLSHQDWPGNYYFRVRPAWVRLSDYYPPRKIEEYQFPQEEAPHAEAGAWRSLWGPKRRQKN